jgi:predicted DsbA family dithiol-disulfide isomerase
MPEQTAPQPRIDVVSDAICPWCYIGKRQLERALALLVPEGLRFEVQWRPYQLNPEMPPQGTDRAAFHAAKFGSAERARQLQARVTEAAASAGLEFHTERIRRIPNTLAAHRTIWLAGQRGVQDAVVEALFRAYFIEARDIGDAAVLAEVAAGAGLERGAVAAMLAGEAGRAEVLAADASARRAGLDGVPSFLMSGYFLFSGAVPGEQMAQAFRQAWTILQNQAA